MDMMTIGKGGMLQGQYRAEMFLCTSPHCCRNHLQTILRMSTCVADAHVCSYAVLATPLILSAPDITKSFSNGKSPRLLPFRGRC